MVDNFAHVGGFLTGFLLTMAVLGSAHCSGRCIGSAAVAETGDFRATGLAARRNPPLLSLPYQGEDIHRGKLWMAVLCGSSALSFRERRPFFYTLAPAGGHTESSALPQMQKKKSSILYRTPPLRRGFVFG